MHIKTCISYARNAYMHFFFVCVCVCVFPRAVLVTHFSDFREFSCLGMGFSPMWWAIRKSLKMSILGVCTAH